MRCLMCDALNALKVSPEVGLTLAISAAGKLGLEKTKATYCPAHQARYEENIRSAGMFSLLLQSGALQ